MKSIPIGCLGIIFGIVIGIALTLGSNFFLPSDGKTFAVTPAPPINSTQSDVSISIHANYLSAQLKPLIARSNLIKQPSLALAAPNIIQLTGTLDVTLGGQRVSTNATIALRVAVQKNRVALTVDKIDASGITIPLALIGGTLEPARAQAEEQINTLITNSLKGTGLKIFNVRVAPNELIVDLTSQ